MMERDSSICSPRGPVSNHDRNKIKSRGFNGGGQDTIAMEMAKFLTLFVQNLTFYEY